MITTTGFRVLVVAAEPAVDLEAVVTRAGQDSSELLVLSLGAHRTDGQRDLTRDALRLAAELRVTVETRLVLSMEDAKTLAVNAREITLAASGPELRKLEAALLPKHPSLLGVANWGEGNGVPPKTTELISPGSREGAESVEALSGQTVPHPFAATFWTPARAKQQKMGHLRIYVGSAPGVGKTFGMLGEAQRRRSRGTDVVVGIAETYGRPMTAEMLTGLEVVPRRRIQYRNAWFEEMDLDAVLRRKPAAALVDELAHTNVPGSGRAKRWEDVLELLSSGIEVITTLNIQHVESLNDVIAEITGIKQQETVPDWMVDLADQVELVDMSPEALQRRMQHGNIYPDPGKAELALRRFFNIENLTALRELALMRVANRVDAELLERWSKGPAPETRERILICLSGADFDEDLVRRGARMAQRLQGDFLALHIRHDSVCYDPEYWQRTAKLVQDLGGELHMEEAESIVGGIVAFAARHHITQCVVGEPRRPRWWERATGSTINRLVRHGNEPDIHVIARQQTAADR